jgi:hypothetical protein
MPITINIIDEYIGEAALEETDLEVALRELSTCKVKLEAALQELALASIGRKAATKARFIAEDNFTMPLSRIKFMERAGGIRKQNPPTADAQTQTPSSMEDTLPVLFKPRFDDSGEYYRATPPSLSRSFSYQESVSHHLSYLPSVARKSCVFFLITKFKLPYNLNQRVSRF